jgi:hypothetical protein
MKRLLLIFLCFFLLTGCSSVVKNNTLTGVDINETEIEILPVTADLAVSEQRTRGEATGKITDINNLTKEALAKALGQEPPSTNMPDVLVGLNAFTEVNGTDLKVILTGYPAYYTNFRTAKAADSLRLNMLNSGASPIYKPEIKEAHEDGGEWYFSIKYQFGDGFGWGLGAGKSWPSNLLQGDFFFGLEIEESGILSPWKYEDMKNVDEIFGLGGSLNVGGVYGELPYDLKLVGGLSAGFWWSEYSYEYWRENSYSWYPGNGYWDYDSHDEYDIMVGPFVKGRWHGLEAGFRLLFGSSSEIQFAIGYTL